MCCYQKTVSRGCPCYQLNAIHVVLLVLLVVGGNEVLYAQPQPARPSVHACRRQEHNRRGHRGHDAAESDRVAWLAAWRGASVRRGIARCHVPLVEVDEQRGGTPKAEGGDDGLARRAVEAVALLNREHVRTEDERDAEAEVVRLRHPRPLRVQQEGQADCGSVRKPQVVQPSACQQRWSRRRQRECAGMQELGATSEHELGCDGQVLDLD
eukprot:scaffold91988_cov63-Phaeocystis_antarctica.AAC.3